MRAFLRKILVFFGWHQPKELVTPVTDRKEPQKAEPREVRPPRRVRRAHDSKVKQLEKARKKFDRFVEPKGERPKKIERRASPKAQKAADIITSDDTQLEDFIIVNGSYIADCHHHDKDSKVLYHPAEMMRGEFNFRDTILDQLDRYFFYVRRMRKMSPEAYSLYRKAGGMISPYISRTILPNEKDEPLRDKYADIPQEFLKTLPAFGCVAYGADPYNESKEIKKNGKNVWIPKFVYFTKYDRAPSKVQHANDGAIYGVTIWWDSPGHGSKYGTPQEFPALVKSDGTVRALRVFNTEIIHKDKYPRNRDSSYIPQKRWSLPNELRQWAMRDHVTSDLMLKSILYDVARGWAESLYCQLRVSVEKNGSFAMFRVPIDKLPYFFKDRDYVLTNSGVRKRILHVVKPFQRSDGSWAPMHFRGQSRFTWAGYNVNITIAGRDHEVIEQFNVPTHSYEDHEKIPRDMISMAKMGKIIRDRISASVGSV